MKNRLSLNPILEKELYVNSRSIKMSIACMLVNLLLATIMVLCLASVKSNQVRLGYDYQSITGTFQTLAIIECIIISLVIPVITSGSISGEREKQTLDLLMTTPVSPMRITIGKLSSAVINVMMYVITSIPVLSIAFILGGMSWSQLIVYIGLIFCLACYVGSVGIFSSSLVKKSITATVVTIIFGVAIVGITCTIFAVSLTVKLMDMSPNSSVINVDGVALSLLLNPYLPIFEFFSKIITGEGLYDIMKDYGTVSGVWKVIYQHSTVISLIINGLVTLLFMKLAALKIPVVREKKRTN